MGWEIRVWHEENGDRTTLAIEASPDVPDEVISSIAGSYWFEEVQYAEDEWVETEELDTSGESPGQPFHG